MKVCKSCMEEVIFHVIEKKIKRKVNAAPTMFDSEEKPVKDGIVMPVFFAYGFCKRTCQKTTTKCAPGQRKFGPSYCWNWCLKENWPNTRPEKIREKRKVTGNSILYLNNGRNDARVVPGKRSENSVRMENMGDHILPVLSKRNAKKENKCPERKRNF